MSAEQRKACSQIADEHAADRYFLHAARHTVVSLQAVVVSYFVSRGAEKYTA